MKVKEKDGKEEKGREGRNAEGAEERKNRRGKGEAEKRRGRRGEGRNVGEKNKPEALIAYSKVKFHPMLFKKEGY